MGVLLTFLLTVVYLLSNVTLSKAFQSSRSRLQRRLSFCAVLQHDAARRRRGSTVLVPFLSAAASPADPSSATSTTTTAQVHPRMGELTPPEAKVFELLNEIHTSGYTFRVVVVGKGAILEFTTPSTTGLGPKLTIAQSPTSGANLLTLAASDASWEYHVQLSQVSKIVLVEKETPSKTLRIVRLLNAVGESMSSLILVVPDPKDGGDSSSDKDAIQWFHKLVEKYGNEMQL